MNTQSPNVLEPGRTLIIGSTGFIGKFVADACLESGRPTYILVRPGATTTPSKASAVKKLQEKGAIIVYGTMTDEEVMEKYLREHKIEVVISTVGGDCIVDQAKLVEAVKAVGSVKVRHYVGNKFSADDFVGKQRFLASEFGHDIDRAEPVEPGLSMYMQKRRVRRLIEEAGIPYTHICCNSIAAWPYHDNTHPADLLPPLDCFHIYGDGSVKAYFVDGRDIGKFTIKTLDDDRTLNKTVHFRLESNLLSINELACMWEQKLGYNLPRVTVTEDDLLSAAKEMRIPESIVAALTHDIFIKGCQINYKLDRPSDVEVCSLYPHIPFRSIDDCFNDFLKTISPKHNPELHNSEGDNSTFIIPNAKPESLVIGA